MTIIIPPHLDIRSAQPTMGIRTIAPFSGMFKVVDQLRKDMAKWVAVNEIEPAGSPFLRYHVIDMRGKMDISFGIPVPATMDDDGRVTPGTLVAGQYASLVFTGSGLTGNKTLIEWVRAQDNLAFDRWDTEQGDNFRCRYESFLTDPQVERLKTKWHIEVAIKLAELQQPDI